MTLAEAIAQLNTSRHEMFNQWGAGIIYHFASRAVIYKQTWKKSQNGNVSTPTQSQLFLGIFICLAALKKMF